MQDRHRLKKSSDFRRVYSARHRRDGPLLAVYCLPNQLAHVRVGLAVSTRVGGAVVRNKVKRRLREVCRGWLEGAGHHGLDLVIVARPESATADFQELSQELKTLLNGLATLPTDGPAAAIRRTPT
jgi:ribonuclease P protein component